MDGHYIRGNVVGDYRVSDSSCMRGSFCEVYRAVKMGGHRVVALKVLREDVKDVNILKKQAVTLKSLDCNVNIVRLISDNTDRDPAHIVLEYVPDTLKKYKGTDIAAAIRLMEGILAGVEITHSKGIVGLDLKTKNILVTHDKVPKLCDFNSARLPETFDDSLCSRLAVDTPLYMAPELFDGAPHSERTDVYCLGLLFYELITGKYAVFRSVKATKVRDDAPKWVDKVITHASNPNPEKRYQNAKEMRQAMNYHVRAGNAADRNSKTLEKIAERFPQAAAVFRAIKNWTGS